MLGSVSCHVCSSVMIAIFFRVLRSCWHVLNLDVPWRDTWFALLKAFYKTMQKIVTCVCPWMETVVFVGSLFYGETCYDTRSVIQKVRMTQVMFIGQLHSSTNPTVQIKPKISRKWTFFSNKTNSTIRMYSSRAFIWMVTPGSFSQL